MSSEYGWSDDQILDLTPARVQLAWQAIQSRRRLEHRRQAMLLELQTKYLVSAAYNSTGGKGAQSAAKKAADKVAFLPKAKQDSGKPISTERALQQFGEPLIPMQEE